MLAKFFLSVLANLFILLSVSSSVAHAKGILFQDANLAEVLVVLAKSLGATALVSSQVKGQISLTLTKTVSPRAYDALLLSQGLARWKVENIWFIAPREELIRQKKAEMEWQQLNEQAMPLLTQTWKLRYAKVEEVVKLIQDKQISLLSKRGKIAYDSRTNLLCVKDIKRNLNELNRLILRVDIPVKQLVIEARIASIDKDCEKALGIELVSNSSEKAIGNVAVTKNSGFVLGRLRLVNGQSLDFKLAALESQGHAELISKPRLFTANQQTASIEAGEEVPYQESTEGGGTAVVFKKAVLGLKVTPQILPNNNILLYLQINQDRPSSNMVLGVPTIRTRQIKTNVLIKAGQTIVLGGIYESNQEKGMKRIPILSQIPVIGYLFIQQTKHINKRELLIFVTPKVIMQTL